ncbi:MAG: hypothetical protein ACRBM6_17205 [Geminicoccales bacterium]
MLGFAKLVGAPPTDYQMSWSCRWKLEASLWAGVSVITWEVLAPIRPPLDPGISMLAEWIAVGLAGIATLTALRVKKRLWRKIAEADELKSIKPPNPLGLIDVLREHGVREFGSMYLYMPMPRRAKHKHAWAWLEMLDMKGLIRGDPWHIKAKHVKDTIRESHPNLFDGNPTQFDVYRLDWRTLTQMMGDDLD